VVVLSHQNHIDFKSLVQGFVASLEYVTKQRGMLTPLTKLEMWHSLTLNSLDLETDAGELQLAACIEKIREAWSHLGNEKPHYSVLTNQQYLPENLDASIDTFWATGMQEAAILQKVLARYGLSELSGKSCVEYGCGVGRVTMGLANCFGQVHGYDISSGHLAVARERVVTLGVSNVCFHSCADSVLMDLEPCDCFYSRIVFQHNPPPVIAGLIRKALDSLNTGGIALFQVPTYGVGYTFQLEKWLKAKNELGMEMHCLPQPVIFKLIADSGCELLEVREDNCTGAPERFISNTFIVRKGL
jgi:SAM-dependent methyltransferase